MSTAVETQARAIVHRTRGARHGGITRLVSPGDLGEFLKPFVFLDLFGFDIDGGHKGFGLHPHSGIATLTYLIEGDTRYEDTTGEQGTLLEGGVEWMRAGNGVWHTGGPAPGVTRVRGFQLWVALPASEENAPAQSLYLAPSQVPREGPARVLLGRHGAAQSAIPAPAPINYLGVQLKDGERWRYVPPAGHTVGWVAVNEGGRALRRAAPRHPRPPRTRLRGAPHLEDRRRACCANGASRCTPASPAPAWSACCAAAPASAPSACAPTWTRCRCRRRTTSPTVAARRPHACLRPRRPHHHAAGRGLAPGAGARFRRHGELHLPARRGDGQGRRAEDDRGRPVRALPLRSGVRAAQLRRRRRSAASRSTRPR
jgi:redox-sensitive bicupin YhaK (pirin superfamily)